MRALRPRLRLLAAAWLLFQVTSLAALVPRDCCAAHRPAAQAEAPSCHEGMAGHDCAMGAADGEPCPMHGAAPAVAHHQTSEICAMRGACDGPMPALAALLSHHGTLAGTFAMSPDDATAAIAPRRHEHLIRRLAAPDPPPPRA